MGFINVLAAAVASFIFGAVWYTVFAKRWIATSGFSGQPMDRNVLWI